MAFGCPGNTGLGNSCGPETCTVLARPTICASGFKDVQGLLCAVSREGFGFHATVTSSARVLTLPPILIPDAFLRCLSIFSEERREFQGPRPPSQRNGNPKQKAREASKQDGVNLGGMEETQEEMSCFLVQPLEEKLEMAFSVLGHMGNTRRKRTVTRR